MDAQNVRVAIATDGFNPYEMLADPYTCWPVFVIPSTWPGGVPQHPVGWPYNYAQQGWQGEGSSHSAGHGDGGSQPEQ